MTATASVKVEGMRCPRCDRELVQTPSNTFLECECPPVDDLAILRDHGHLERRVLAEHFETPSEDIRDALQIMRLYEGTTFDAAVRADVIGRIETALHKLELLDELMQNPVRFTLRVGQIERQLKELRHRFDAATLGAYRSEGAE